MHNLCCEAASGPAILYANIEQSSSPVAKGAPLFAIAGVDSRTGERRWKKEYYGRGVCWPIEGAPLTACESRTPSGNFLKLISDDGEERDLGKGEFSSAMVFGANFGVAFERDSYYVAGIPTGGSVSKFGADGQKMWSSQKFESGVDIPVVLNDRILAGKVALSKDSGQRLERVDVGQAIQRINDRFVFQQGNTYGIGEYTLPSGATVVGLPKARQMSHQYGNYELPPQASTVFISTSGYPAGVEAYSVDDVRNPRWAKSGTLLANVCSGDAILLTSMADGGMKRRLERVKSDTGDIVWAEGAREISLPSAVRCEGGRWVFLSAREIEGIDPEKGSSLWKIPVPSQIGGQFLDKKVFTSLGSNLNKLTAFTWD